MSSRKLFISLKFSSAPGFMQKLLPVGLSLPQTFSKPFHSCTLFDRSQFSGANGVTSLQVSDDFASLSSLLNLLRKIQVLKMFPPFHGSGHSTALGPRTGLAGGGQTWGFSAFLLPLDCVCFALREV